VIISDGSKGLQMLPGRRIVEDRVAANPSFSARLQHLLLSGRDNFDLRYPLQLASRQVVTRPRPKARRLPRPLAIRIPTSTPSGKRVLHAERFWP
jgi:hypothetical protein